MTNAFKEEQAYLDYAKKALDAEIKQCQENMREIPKKYTNVLQGDSFLVEGLMSTESTKLRQLELSVPSPYFGRIDFLKDGDTEVAKIYIGKTSITDVNNNHVTLDWRTPICSLYYEGATGKVSYEAPAGTMEGELKLKRQIIIENGELKEVLDTDLVSNDELLRPYLSTNTDTKMKTIIASIQQEQNRIIRKPIEENIIVQGVAGSGKTSVALHRIAYLLYSLKESIISNQFLVIGPNKYFLNYISSILPELETEPVSELTFIDLVNFYLDEKYTQAPGNSILEQKEENETGKKIASFKSSLEYKDLIEKFMSEYLEHGIAGEGIIIDGEIVFDNETIKRILFSSTNGQPNYEMACNYFVKKFKDNQESIYSKLNEKYRRVYTALPKGDSRRNEAIAKSTDLSRLVKEKGTKIIRDYFKKLKPKVIDLYKQFVASLNNYPSSLNEREVLTLQKESLTILKKKAIPFEDLAALMYINYLLSGKTSKYKHIVIDEAQDYGLFHFSVLKEIFPEATFSIYGDLAQSIYSYRSIEDWQDVNKTIFNGEGKILNLSKSYRTSIEITNNANRVLRNMSLPEADPVIRHGKEITYQDCANSIEYKAEKISEWLEQGYKTIAVICKTEKEAATISKKLQSFGIDISYITEKDSEYQGRVFVLTSAISKGLEFDAVIINDASSNMYREESAIDKHLLYVGCTRALHELVILYNKELTSILGIEPTILNKDNKKLTKKK